MSCYHHNFPTMLSGTQHQEIKIRDKRLCMLETYKLVWMLAHLQWGSMTACFWLLFKQKDKGKFFTCDLRKWKGQWVPNSLGKFGLLLSQHHSNFICVAIIEHNLEASLLCKGALYKQHLLAPQICLLHTKLHTCILSHPHALQEQLFFLCFSLLCRILILTAL